MITKEIIENPLFIIEKNKYIKFDIESSLYKKLKLRTGMEISKNFMAMEIQKQMEVFGIVGTFYVPLNTKSIKINILGNEHEMPVQNTNPSNDESGKFISVNTFLPIDDGDLKNNDILTIAKTFIMENSPFAISVLFKENIVMVNNNNGKQTIIKDAITHYTEFSDTSFIISCYKIMDLSELLNSDTINSIKNKEIKKLLSGLKGVPEGKKIQVPLGIYSIIKGELDETDSVEMAQSLDDRFPCFVEENFEERNQMIFSDNFDAQITTSSENLYLFENLDKVIYLSSKDITENINDDITNFLKSL
jgi:hypothetical protein